MRVSRVELATNRLIFGQIYSTPPSSPSIRYKGDLGRHYFIESIQIDRDQIQKLRV